MNHYFKQEFQPFINIFTQPDKSKDIENQSFFKKVNQSFITGLHQQKLFLQAIGTVKY